MIPSLGAGRGPSVHDLAPPDQRPNRAATTVSEGPNHQCVEQQAQSGRRADLGDHDHGTAAIDIMVNANTRPAAVTTDPLPPLARVIPDYRATSL
jgi:hypothetical protein